jgi:hypothetical protein
MDLLKEFEVGQKVRLTLYLNASIELLAQIVWTQARSLAGESYRSGMKITELSPENIRRLGHLLARATPGFPPLSSMAGKVFSC